MTFFVSVQGWRLDPDHLLMIILLLIGILLRPLLELHLYLSMQGYIKHNLVSNTGGEK